MLIFNAATRRGGEATLRVSLELRKNKIKQFYLFFICFLFVFYLFFICFLFVLNRENGIVKLLSLIVEAPKLNWNIKIK